MFLFFCLDQWIKLLEICKTDTSSNSSDRHRLFAITFLRTETEGNREKKGILSYFNRLSDANKGNGIKY